MEDLGEVIRERLREYNNGRRSTRFRFRDRTDEELDENNPSPQHLLEHEEHKRRVFELYYDWISLLMDAPCPATAYAMAGMFAQAAAAIAPIAITKAEVERRQERTDSKEQSVVDQVKKMLEIEGQSGAPAQPSPVLDDIFKQFPGLRDAA